MVLILIYFILICGNDVCYYTLMPYFIAVSHHVFLKVTCLNTFISWHMEIVWHMPVFIHLQSENILYMFNLNRNVGSTVWQHNVYIDSAVAYPTGLICFASKMQVLVRRFRVWQGNEYQYKWAGGEEICMCAPIYRKLHPIDASALSLHWFGQWYQDDSTFICLVSVNL